MPGVAAEQRELPGRQQFALEEHRVVPRGRPQLPQPGDEPARQGLARQRPAGVVQGRFERPDAVSAADVVGGVDQGEQSHPVLRDGSSAFPAASAQARAAEDGGILNGTAKETKPEAKVRPAGRDAPIGPAAEIPLDFRGRFIRGFNRRIDPVPLGRPTGAYETVPASRARSPGVARGVPSRGGPRGTVRATSGRDGGAGLVVELRPRVGPLARRDAPPNPGGEAGEERERHRGPRRPRLGPRRRFQARAPLALPAARAARPRRGPGSARSPRTLALLIGRRRSARAPLPLDDPRSVIAPARPRPPRAEGPRPAPNPRRPPPDAARRTSDLAPHARTEKSAR